jgi:hypothetical protein
MAIKLSKNGKRLGRPPKNSTGKVFVATVAKPKLSAKLPDQSVVDPEKMIECELIKVPQYSHLVGTDTKDGRYMTSLYGSVDGFGRKRWVVGGYLKADWNKYRIIKMGEQEIIQRCINYLNAKDGGIYGNLEYYNVKFIQKFGQEVAVVELITNERKNENFWGEGEKV